MSTLEEIQKRIDDLEKEWAGDSSGPVDASPREIVLPETDLSGPTPATEATAPSGPPPAAPPPAAAPPPSAPQSAGGEAERSPIPSSPIRSGGAPDWAKLQRDLQDAEGRASTQRNIQQAYATISPNHSFHADPNAGSEDIATAKAPLELAQARQHFEQGQAAMGAEKRKEDLQAAEMDPSSPQSQRARGALKGFFGDTKLLPPDFDTYSAADVSKFSTTLVPLAKDQSEERRAAAKAAADAKTKAEADADRDRQFALNQQKADEEKRARGVSEAEIKRAHDEEARHHRVDESTQAKLAGNVAATTPGDYSKIPEGVRETVKAIVEGRAPAPPPGSRYGQGLMNYVTQVAPNFDASAYGRYQGVAEQQAKSGDIVALNTAYNHLDRAAKNIPDNFSPQMLNRAKQVLLTGSGADTLTPFETDVKIAADELAKAYGNNAEAGRAAVEHLLDPNQSPAQLKARLSEARELLAGKKAAFEQQREAVTPASLRKPAGEAPEPVVTLVAKDGRSKSVKKSVADQFLKDHPGEATVRP